MNYTVAIALIGIFGIWGWHCNITYKRRVLRLKGLADMDRTAIGGQSVTQWLDVLNRDTGMTLITKDAGVLNILGHPVLLVDGKVPFTTLGRFGAIGGWSQMLFLVAIDPDSISALKARRKELKWLNGTEKCAAFSIRHLEDVIALCTPFKT